MRGPVVLYPPPQQPPSPPKRARSGAGAALGAAAWRDALPLLALALVAAAGIAAVAALRGVALAQERAAAACGGGAAAAAPGASAFGPAAGAPAAALPPALPAADAFAPPPGSALWWTSYARRRLGNPFFRHALWSTPLYRIEEPPALPPATFAALRAAVLGHPLRWRSNGLNEDNFGQSSGWVIYFKGPEGVARVCGSTLFAGVCPFFHHVRLPEANVWVMNVLDGLPTPKAGPGARGAVTAGEHRDDTLEGVMPPDAKKWDAFSHETNVLYVKIPADMEGGRLELWPAESDGSDSAAAAAAAATAGAGAAAARGRRGAAGGGGGGSRGGGGGKVVVVPRENKIVRFRGDALHRVRKHHSAKGEDRISLVLEQYLIPEPWYHDLPTLWMGGQDDNADELRPLRASGALPRLDQGLPWRARIGDGDDDDEDEEADEE
ncbi:hypothetical protein Rsub_04818 [Raphidocelis subcapitata]|uniref:Uncharacterized protein n=1 Tax=Raphidocelis subcapitata TaxID=307507 RepID=A0A2V0NUY4_9CHLO|nr:hypothetical protein Rsub_04818 [Raphidocelis subcapitata]|eukprot:GBF91149.1 hypothetical protein Rsub_04818 [Raphidocelis subcapitata]